MIGRTIGHYQLIAELGRGGMGVVYLARDANLRREVALKFLPEALAQDRRALERLRREGIAASALNHPHICTIHEIGEDAGLLFIAMEHVDGRPLGELILPDGMPVDTLVRYGLQISGGLAHAHERGVIHRDLKTSNIAVTHEGQAKILDFGLAVHPAIQSEEATRSLDAPVGRSGISGTLPYLAPEVLAGQEADSRSDLWALGVLLYQMAAGRLPFHGRTSFETSSAILRESPPPLPPRIPAGLRAIIQRCLIKEPAERYQSAREVRAALEAVSLDTSGIPARRESTQALARSRRMRAAIVAGGVLVLAAILAVLTFPYWSGPAPAQGEFRTLAVLPIRSIGQDADSDYLGMGFTDTIITKVSQISDLTVRPSSAVRKYATAELGALEAARELQVDAVLDGTLQRVGDRIRINVNLLRVRDGSSLWSASLNENFTDVFAIQDQIAEQVTEGLRGSVSSAEHSKLAKRYTSTPQAYEFFLRGEQAFDKRSLGGSKPLLETAIQMYQRAIELDPNYALAHAQLAYAFTWMALFDDPDEPAWRTRAEEALQRAEAIDPSLVETHLVRHELHWSFYGGFNISAAIHELRRAQEINPNQGHHQLGVLYAHMGLENAAARELNRSLEQDPASAARQSWYLEAFDLVGKPEEAIAAWAKLENPQGASSLMRKSFMWMQQYEQAEAVIRMDLARAPDSPMAQSNMALLTALRGNFAKAEAELPKLIRRSQRSRAFHHLAYNVASIYALQGKGKEAVEWLRKTVETGMPNYTLFSRDPHLDPIRQQPAFVAFMNDLKPRWEAYKREFDP